MFRRRRFCLYMLILLAIVVLASLFKNIQLDPIPPLKSLKTTEISQPKLRDIVSHVVRMPNARDELKKASKIIYWSNTVILSDHFFLTSPNNSVKILYTGVDLMNRPLAMNILDEIATPFLLVSSDLPKKIGHGDVKRLLRATKRFKEDFLVIPYQHESLECLSLKFALKEWTIGYRKIESDICGAVIGKHVIFTRLETLKKIPNPWLLPFPDALFLQSFAIGAKIRIIRNFKFQMGHHSNGPESYEHRYGMYENFKIKKVVWDDRIEWYGCSRNSSRCFGTVFNDTPEYLYHGRWTPPCCLRVLRETARYVFRVLEFHKVRYWLEGGSLLGAMRNGDVIPWDYDVDVGVYRQDLTRCPWIREIHKQIDRGVKFPSIEDKHGYIWELSRPEEGQFYRIQSSRTNRLHVDIFPFYSKNGLMTKDTWMISHKQDREFPESFLKPITKIPFVGMRVSAPNNIREFLELKFGPGCVENAEYPNPNIMTLPKVTTTTTSSPDDY